MNSGRTLVLFLLFSISFNARGNELGSMNLEQLMDMNVTTVSKREQTFGSAAAAIFTISQQDIRRSGATSLPEVLTQSPGIEVARINPALWAITARGFNFQFANRLLVLIDGRSIYTPLFSGVYWDEQIPPLDEIQRIEIIRGPGASLWGSNAVNGVINIVTYDSESTQGGKVVAGMGNEEKGFVRSRYGFKNSALTGRVNAQFRKVDEALDHASKKPSNDGFNAKQIGTRLDWRPSITDKGALDVSYTETHRRTDIYLPLSTASLVDPRESFGAHSYYILGSWMHQIENGDSVFLQAYLDVGERIDPLNSSERTTTDYELQYNHEETENHRITWGLEYRYIRHEGIGSFVFFTSDTEIIHEITTAFIQDEYRVTEAIKATIGVKLEEGSTANAEYQPSIRVAWQPTENTTLWGAVSRAIRSPSIFEGSSTIEFRRGVDFNPNIYGVAKGNDNIKSEVLYAYESGIRLQATENLLIDITGYINEYKRLYSPVSTSEFRFSDPLPNYIGFVANFENVSKGRAGGIELATDYALNQNWRIKTAYTYYNFSTRSEQRADSTPLETTTAKLAEFRSPLHQARIAFTYNPVLSWSIDWSLRYVENLEFYSTEIPAFIDLSARIYKQITDDFSIALVGKNLLEKSRLEFYDNYYGPLPTELERSIFLQCEWQQ